MKTLDGFHKFVQSSPALPILSESQMQFGAFIQSPKLLFKDSPSVPASNVISVCAMPSKQNAISFRILPPWSGETYAKYHLPLLSHRTYDVLTTSNTFHPVDSSVSCPVLPYSQVYALRYNFFLTLLKIIDLYHCVSLRYSMII